MILSCNISRSVCVRVCGCVYVCIPQFCFHMLYFGLTMLYTQRIVRDIYLPPKCPVIDEILLNCPHNDKAPGTITE